MHFQEGPYHPPSPKNFLCRFTLISGMVLGVGKNLKSDNYLNIFIPALSQREGVFILHMGGGLERQVIPITVRITHHSRPGRELANTVLP